jgi:hypothetical protein
MQARGVEAVLSASGGWKATVAIVKLSSNPEGRVRFRNGDCRKVSDIVLSSIGSLSPGVGGQARVNAGKSL